MEDNTETIRYDIKIEAKVALATMREMLKTTDDNAKKIQMFSEIVLASANLWNVSWKKALDAYRQLNSEIAKSKKGGTLFGNVGGQDLFAQSGNYLQSLQDTKRVVDGVTISTNGMVEGVKKIEPAANKAGKGLFSLKNIARTALGTFEAMAIFFVTQFVGNAIKKVIDSLLQMEMALYKVQTAEKALSEYGVEISTKDITGIAKDITDMFSFISDIDALKMVSNLSLLTKDLKLTKEQLDALAKSAVALSIRKNITLDDAIGQLINGLTTSGKGLKDLGITVDAQIIKEKILASGLVESEEAYKKLTAAQKQEYEVLALLQIITESTAGELKSMDGFTGTLTEHTKNLSAEWENLTTVIGQVLSPVLKLATQALTVYVQLWISGFTGIGVAFAEFLAVFIAGNNIINNLAEGRLLSDKERLEAYEEARRKAYAGLFPTGVPDLQVGGLKIGTSNLLGTQDYTRNTDTPTGRTTGGVGEETQENTEELAKALEEMNQEIIEAQIKFSQDMEEIQIDLGRKMVDITLEYAKKRAEAEMSYNNQVIDINIDYDNKLADLNAKIQDENDKSRQRELERERNFQNKMKELKEDFLMDLEDALHARDARQILRLIKQYELEKKQAERQHALDKKNAQEEDELRKKQLERERQQIEIERQRKLEEAARDLQLKLTALAADEEAERAAATLAAQRKQEDLEREIGDRLELIAAKLVEEYNLTEQGLQSILNLYMSYYGQIGGIWTAMMSMLTGMGGIALPPPDPRRGRGFAEGGTMVANRPTTVTFGETGMEMATFTPIGRTGRDVNKMFSSLGNTSGNGAGGKVSIELLLSPDLESKIVNNTLNQTAEVFTRTLRTKR